MTKNTPKPMLKVNGKPILEWIIKRFTDQGYGSFIISLGYLGEQIRNYFRDGSAFNCKISYVQESEPLGTAGALSLIDVPSENIIVSNADVLASVDYDAMLRFHRNHCAAATIGATTHRIEIPFGVLQTSGPHLAAIHEKPGYDYPISAGVYVLHRSALEALPGGAVDMPEFMQLLIDSLHTVSVFPISGQWLDVGMPKQLEMATAIV